MLGIFGKKKEGSDTAPTLFVHTDIHSHIVPGIDDGSPDAGKSVELVGRMMSWGIDRIIATPHVTLDTFENTPEILANAYSSLTDALAEAKLTPEIDYSAEYRMDEFFLQELEKGNIRPLPNDYLLVECSYVQEPWNLDNLLFDLKMRGYRTILAHPERYIYYHDKRNRYTQMHNVGTFFQVNLLSLSGYYGKNEKKTAEWLLDQGMIDFVGTDLHHNRHAEAIEAYLRSKDYRKHLPKLEKTVRNDTAFV